MSWSSLASSWQLLMEVNLFASISTCVLALEIEKLECIRKAGMVVVLWNSCYLVDYLLEFEIVSMDDWS